LHNIITLILRHAMITVFVGAGIGLWSAYALARYVSSVLYGVSVFDGSTYFAAALLVSAVAIVACVIPARRAARIDPLSALRSQ